MVNCLLNKTDEYQTEIVGEVRVSDGNYYVIADQSTNIESI